MTTPGINTLKRVLRTVKNRWHPQGLILMYHRIGEKAADPWNLCVTPQHFREQIDILQQRSKILPLSRLTAALEHNELAPDSVAITFDDGYADNLYQAKPLLQRDKTPASFFLTTGQVGRRREFWWDELERLLLQPGRLPQILQLDIGPQALTCDLGATACYDEKTYHRHRSWQAGQPPPAERQQLYYNLWQLLYGLPECERWKLLQQIERCADIEPTVRTTHRALSHDEIVALAQDDFVEIGAHTESHAVLTGLTSIAQHKEIRRSRQNLEKLLQKPIAGFAYPHGQYTNTAIEILKTIGIRYACTTLAKPLDKTADVFQLPRVPVPDLGADQFGRWLAYWQNYRTAA